MNSKSYFVLLLVSAVLLVGLVARNGNVLLLAIPFLVYLAIGILECPVEVTLRARREIDKAQAMADEPIGIRVMVENQGKALANVELIDPIPEGMAVRDGKAQERAAWPSGAVQHLDYTVSARRGLYQWKTVHVTASDPCGLFELKRDISAPGEIPVRPASLRLHGVRLQPRSTLHAPGPIAARLAGAGTDFWEVREYRPGDTLRRLNWRLSGRHPHRLFTNEYEGEEIADFGLILDARRLTRAHDVEEALFESSVRAASSLAESFLKSGNRIALLVFGEVTTYLYPGYGKRQLSRVRHELARAALGPNLSLRYLEYFPTRLFPSRSVIVVFSETDPRDLETYARLRAYGYDVVLISPDPVEYMRQTLPSTEVNGLAIRAARVERAVHLKRLLKMGIGVVDWPVSEPLDTLLQRSVTYTIHRRGL